MSGPRRVLRIAIAPADVFAQVVCEFESCQNQYPHRGYGGDELRIHLSPSSILLSDEMPGVEAVISIDHRLPAFAIKPSQAPCSRWPRPDVVDRCPPSR